MSWERCKSVYTTPKISVLIDEHPQKSAKPTQYIYIFLQKIANFKESTNKMDQRGGVDSNIIHYGTIVLPCHKLFPKGIIRNGKSEEEKEISMALRYYPQYLGS